MVTRCSVVIKNIITEVHEAYTRRLKVGKRTPDKRCIVCFSRKYFVYSSVLRRPSLQWLLKHRVSLINYFVKC